MGTRKEREKSKKTFGLLIPSCLRLQDIRSISGLMNYWRRRSSMSLWRDGGRSFMRLSMAAGADPGFYFRSLVLGYLRMTDVERQPS
jgi:hypothetical protein